MIDAASGAQPGPSRLRISEIFFSLQGETTRSGLPTVFIRLTGCPLRCTWCDSTYAFSGGQLMTQDDVMLQVAGYRTRYVCVTGGEPLAQKACIPLLTRLCDAGYSVSLETSGALDVSAVDRRVSRIIDLKPPGSGECSRNLDSHWEDLRPSDELKAVLTNRADFDWAVSTLTRHDAWQRCPILFSPVQGQLAATDLAQWILDDQIPVRFQIQLHKVLWGNTPGR